MSSTRDHHREDPSLLRQLSRRCRAKVRNAPVLGPNDNYPVKLLALPHVSGEQVDSGHAEKRVLVPLGEALSWCLDLLRDQCSPAEIRARIRVRLARLLGSCTVSKSAPVSEVCQRVRRSPARGDVKPRQHGSDRLRGIRIQDRVIPTMEFQSACLHLLIHDAPTRAGPRDDADPLVRRPLQHVTSEVDCELGLVGDVRECQFPGEPSGWPPVGGGARRCLTPSERCERVDNPQHSRGRAVRLCKLDRRAALGSDLAVDVNGICPGEAVDALGEIAGVGRLLVAERVTIRSCCGVRS